MAEEAIDARKGPSVQPRWAIDHAVPVSSSVWKAVIFGSEAAARESQSGESTNGSPATAHSVQPRPSGSNWLSRGMAAAASAAKAGGFLYPSCASDHAVLASSCWLN